jgi:hypothetical protein
VVGRRHHVVLIPGFAGFDALGQLEYYARVTPLFGGRVNTTLHYFDNFPTAAVATRSDRLLAYLAKRIARAEISRADEITLVGHSTGGLDIRALIWKLHIRERPILVDGGVRVEPAAVLDAIRRVVFLSVPHWGANIADWVRSHPVWRQIVVADLRAAASASGCPIPAADRVGPGIAALAARFTRSGLFQAVEDSLRESDPGYGRASLNRLAEAHESASQLDLYLRHIMADFHAIDDLAVEPRGDVASPAHYPPDRRAAELRLWRKQQIDTRSYATVGPRPFRFTPGEPAPVWEMSRPWTGLDILRPSAARKTDIVYRTCYRACAGGPFSRLPASNIPADLELWDNDGIVNTASMDWPIGDTILLRADHMDVVGHFESVVAPVRGGRRYTAYDLLGSASGFDEDDFRALWEDVFTWAETRVETSASARVPAPVTA